MALAAASQATASSATAPAAAAIAAAPQTALRAAALIVITLAAIAVTIPWVAIANRLLLLSRNAGYLSSVAFSPDGHTLALGTADNTINLWDPRA